MMMSVFPAEEIGRWLLEEYLKVRPDIVVPIGHRIFDLLYLLDNHSPEFADLLGRVVDITAISYIDCDNKKIMLIDEETEYGRKFIYDAFPQFEGSVPDSVSCYTVFLCNEKEAQQKRTAEIGKFENEHPNDRIFATALKSIKSYQSFEKGDKFHSLIYLFRKFVEASLHRPYNVDATIFQLSFVDEHIQLERKLSSYGHVFSYTDDKFTFFPLSFDRQQLKVGTGIDIKDEGLLKLRFFRIGSNSMIISPMAYLPIEFGIDFARDDWEELYKEQTLLYEMLKAWKANVRLKPNLHAYLLRLYDVVAFWMDVELFRFLIRLFNKAKINFRFALDHKSCVSHYGERLGATLAKLIEDYLNKSLEVETDLDFRVDYQIDPSEITVDAATLIAMKAACLETYWKNGVMVRRKGLTFSGIQKRLGLDPTSVSVGIDLLCDGACLKPYDALEKDSQVARFYNTDIEEFIGIFVKLLRRAEAKGIPMGKMNLNKFMTFLSYFPLSMFDSVKGHIMVFDAPEGKVVHIVQNDLNVDHKLEDILTSFPKYCKVFRYDGDEYKINDNAFESEHDFYEHMTIIESENIFDISLDILFELYEKVTDFLKKHPEIRDSRNRPRTIYDAFPGLIELIGKEFPEGGLEILGVLAQRSLFLYQRHLDSGEARFKEAADELLFHSIPHKIAMYQQFSEAYFECYKLMSSPSDSNRGKVWQQMCVFPRSSLILELCDCLVKHMQEKLALDTNKIKGLKEKVDPFLDLMINSSSPRKSEIASLSPNSFGDWYIVSIDVKNSTKLDGLYDPRWKKTKEYFRNIMYRWAELFNGRLINTVGDEIFVAFPDFELACSFASGSCTHINELAESINRCKTFRDIETGSYGKIVFGTITVDSNGDCDSSEIDVMCKQLPKVDGKIVVDEKTVGTYRYPGQVIIISDGKRPYFALDPRDEFRRLILSKFELEILPK